jgi:GST-like protein
MSAFATRSRRTSWRLSSFPITRNGRRSIRTVCSLYSLNTPNGIKVSLMLEETGLPYEPHLVSFDKNDQTSPVPVAESEQQDSASSTQWPGRQAAGAVESGAILIYLAEKTGKFMSADPALRYETIQWVMFQMGSIGPMFGQVGFFHKFAGKDFEDKRPRDRYVAESARLLKVLNERLKGRQWIMGDDYTIADIATFPWVRNLLGFYEAGDLVGIDNPEVQRVLAAFVARPAVQRAVNIPKRPNEPPVRISCNTTHQRRSQQRADRAGFLAHRAAIGPSIADRSRRWRPARQHRATRRVVAHRRRHRADALQIGIAHRRAARAHAPRSRNLPSGSSHRAGAPAPAVSASAVPPEPAPAR